MKFLSLLTSINVLLNLIFSALPYAFKPVLEVDAASIQAEVTTVASGFLYGLAEEGVPGSNIAESIDISSASQKVIDGLQHPIGDVNHVAGNLTGCDYIVVYLQDAYDTWYYDHAKIAEMREKGTYNWETYVKEDFFPRVEKSVTALAKADYADKLVYCLYNECDNGIWFGDYYAEGTDNFYKGWLMTYNYVKSLNPDALIGGPGFYEYNMEKISSFLTFCRDNNCLPDVMIYHELQADSSAFWEDHVKEYRNLEKGLSINELPIIVTEYGCMDECGVPGKMLHYVAAAEKTGVWGNVAYWRLADNLCDTAADTNTPNSEWWLYRWYADLEGSQLETKIIDLTHSDFANTFKYRRDRVHYTQLDGMASINDSEDSISVILGGCDYESTVALKNLKKTNFGKTVKVTVEGVYYKGLSGAVTAPVLVNEYEAKLTSTLKIKVPCNDKSSVYRVTVTTSDGDIRQSADNLPQRFEFENGTLLGDSYLYHSAYGTTGEWDGMEGGNENQGDGVTLDFTAPADGEYKLSIIYGKANDGAKASDRIDARVNLDLDGTKEVISFKNTIRSEFTDSYDLTRYLKAGNHTITITHNEGTFVVDSLLVSDAQLTDICVMPDADRTNEDVTAFLAVVPGDGAYELKGPANASFTVNGYSVKTDAKGCAVLFLPRGLSYIEWQGKADKCSVEKSPADLIIKSVSADEMTLSDGAVINNGTLEGISCEGGKAGFTVTCDKPQTVCLTITYSNNAEGGVHDYNVDLIEQYVTVTAGGTSQNVWCRNTYSDTTFKTVTAYLDLQQGDNIVTLTNSGYCRFNGNISYAPHISGVTVYYAGK